MYFKADDQEICSLLYLYHLGGYVVNGVDELEDQYGDHASSFDYFVKDLRGMCEAYDRKVYNNGDGFSYESLHGKYVPKMVIQAVTASPGQDEQAEWLKRIGFTPSGPFSKLKHSGTTLTFWHMSGHEFVKSIGYVCKYDPANQESEASCAA
jgi:hypothetical protein